MLRAPCRRSDGIRRSRDGLRPLLMLGCRTSRGTDRSKPSGSLTRSAPFLDLPLTDVLPPSSGPTCDTQTSP
jgi:hypothetical protein